MPIKFNYSFLQKTNWELYASLGAYLATHISYVNKSFLKTPDGNVQTNRSSAIDVTLNFALSGSFGVERILSKKLSLRIEPIFTVINSKFDVPVKTYSYSIGSEVGLYYNF